MTIPMSPGWYPAPDGNGEQWWNGAGWSEGRRNADGTTPGVPGYQAAPPPAAAPVPLSAPNPYAQPARPATGARVPTSPALVGLIFGALSLFVFPPLGVVGIVLGIISLRKRDATGANRGMAIGAIVLGAIGLVIGLVQLIVFIVSIGPVVVDIS